MKGFCMLYYLNLFNMDIEKINIHVAWNHVTVVPLAWQKKVLGQQGLTDINDFSDNTGQIMLLFVDSFLVFF